MSLGICQQCGQGAELLNGKTCIGCVTWDAGTAGDVAFAMKHGRWINPCDVEDEDASDINSREN